MPIRAIPRRYEVKVLSDDELRAVHEGALQVLQRVGFSTTNERLLKLMADLGQEVDFDARRIRLDPGFVMDAVKLAPARYTLCARDPANDLVLDGDHAYLSSDGCPAEIIDLDSGQKRYGRKDDLATIARVADALPQIAFLWQSVSAGDVPVHVRPMHETHAQFPNTTKHIQQMTAVDAFNARGLVEMLTVISGSRETLRERPIMSSFQCSISPLHWDEGPVDAMEVLAEAGVPVGVLAMPLAAATAPATVAGLLTIANAEVLSGIAILETLVPGAKTFYSTHATTIDMNFGSLNPAWGPEDLFVEMAVGQIGRSYGIPSAAGTLGTGSKAPDWQAGAHNALSQFTKALSVSDMISGAGSLFGDSIFHLPSLVLDCEITEILIRWAEGFRFDAETIALDTIEQVGPGGHFLGEQHTLDHMREFWRTTVMNRQPWEAWEADGRPEPSLAAEAEVRRILAQHEPEPLPVDVARELDRILAAYEAAPDEAAT